MEHAGVKRAVTKGYLRGSQIRQTSNNIDMTVTNERLRIELTESATGTFFNSGSAIMSEDASDLLKTPSRELGKLPNKVALEGHTDSKPHPVTATYLNWELSANRANAARRFMEQAGLRPSRVFADQRLRKSEDPLDPSNRRISLIVQYESKTDSGAESAEKGTVRGNGEGGGKEGARESQSMDQGLFPRQNRSQKRVTAR
jgi:chemotaxis protein MotB